MADTKHARSTASSTSSSKCSGCSRSFLPLRRSTTRSLASYVRIRFGDERQLTSTMVSSALAKSPTFTATRTVVAVAQPPRRVVVVHSQLLVPTRLPRPPLAPCRVRETSLRLATSIRRPKLVAAAVGGLLEVLLQPLRSSLTRTRRSDRTHSKSLGYEHVNSSGSRPLCRVAMV